MLRTLRSHSAQEWRPGPRDHFSRDSAVQNGMHRCRCGRIGSASVHLMLPRSPISSMPPPQQLKLRVDVSFPVLDRPDGAFSVSYLIGQKTAVSNAWKMSDTGATFTSPDMSCRALRRIALRVHLRSNFNRGFDRRGRIRPETPRNKKNDQPSRGQ